MLNVGAMEILVDAMITGDPSGAIERQEAKGQYNFVANDTLPKECLYCSREQLEEMGIVFGDEADDLFVRVQLPKGWKKVPTSHAMWSELLDEQGRKRASIFYKAAFYDRSAHISLDRRFAFDVQSGNDRDFGDYDRDTEPMVCVVTDCGQEIWRSEAQLPSEETPWYRLSDQLRNLGIEWLDKHYPEWEDPLAYWGKEATC